MSNQSISDYLTKEIFIDRNIVTYRSLSRHLAIHVNVAKNELAAYHHDAPYKSQTCAATYLLSGTLLRKYQYRNVSSDDVDMEEGYASTQEDEGDGDGDDVPQVQFTIVNEKDLEVAKASYYKVHSIHVYSLSPSPIHDAGLVCAPTEYVRNMDKNAAIDMASNVGRVVGADIKMKNLKKGQQSVMPVAGPSKSKLPSVLETKPSVKEPVSGADNPKEKPKASGKLGFFKAKPKEIKKEEPAKEAEKKMFFTKASSPATSAASVKAKLEPLRGVKRKSSVGLEPRARTPENPVVTNNVRVKGRVVLTDDESDTVDPPPKRTTRQKSKVALRTETPEREIDQAAMALMDIDDDQVEKVVHETSTDVSTAKDEEETSDVDMADGTTSELKKIRKKREKKIIPVGKNGLKKKKVMKTKRTMDGNGYMRTEDYSDWESVDEETEPPTKPKGKRMVVSVKKEDENTQVPPVPDLKDNTIEVQVPQNTPVHPVKKKQSKSSAKAKPQKGLLNFFGPKS